MACAHPMVAGVMPGRTKNGKAVLRFLGKARSWHGPAPVNGMVLPCRQCVCCRLAKSSEWALRLMHETKFHESASFITLTYDDDHVPLDRSLNKSHFRTFRNDLRGRLDYYGLGKVKFFGVGEYGDQSGRPHYHAIVYGGHLNESVEGFERSEEEPSRTGGLQWSHGLLGEVWDKGFHRISEVNFASAAYVARYALKKVSGAFKESHYGGRTPEFQSASNGIGRAWLEAWKGDLWNESISVEREEGKRVTLPIPEYYFRVLEKMDPKMFGWLKAARVRERPDALEWFQDVQDRARVGAVKEYARDRALIRGGF